VIQRFNSALTVAPHFHSLFIDGVYSFPSAGKPIFHPVRSPSDEDVAEVAAAVFRRVERKLAEREPDAVQSRFVEDAPLLVALAETSARGVIATGPRRGCRVLRVRGARADVDAFVMGRLCAEVEGLQPPGRHADSGRRSRRAGTHGLLFAVAGAHDQPASEQPGGADGPSHQGGTITRNTR
jgi:hypothetical protein